jgi:CRISPR-associated protein Cmr3
MKTYTLKPQDVLFFRDSRPIDTGGGHGARWPEPSIIFDALHAALWRAFPDPQPWEHAHHFGRSSDRPGHGADPRSQRFGSLKTAGVFPVLDDGRWVFPAPQDVVSARDNEPWLLQLQKATGTNLPVPWLQYSPASFAQPAKGEASAWWTREGWMAYLDGKRPHASESYSNATIFSEEWTTGIGIDPETQTQDGARIYSAQYLRLKPDVSCAFAASLPVKQNGKPAEVGEKIDELFRAQDTIIVGGQQRCCQVKLLSTPLAELLPVGGPITGRHVKWVLLTPAVFPAICEDASKGIARHDGGWLPNWVGQEDGQVKLRLRKGALRRRWDATKKRTVREAEETLDINARLVAARVPKPIPIVGWTERLHLLDDEKEIWVRDDGENAHGPRATHLAVPAGAVYYFEAATELDAQHLAAALNWHGANTAATAVRNRRSTLLGEKGFGLGVCGTWNFLHEHPSPPPAPEAHL